MKRNKVASRESSRGAPAETIAPEISDAELDELYAAATRGLAAQLQQLTRERRESP